MKKEKKYINMNEIERKIMFEDMLEEIKDDLNTSIEDYISVYAFGGKTYMKCNEREREVWGGLTDYVYNHLRGE